MWTEITGIKDNKIVERFNMLETYGDIVDCTLNGKAMTPQEAREYLSKLPEAKESWDYWQDLEE